MESNYNKQVKALRHCMTKEDGITICELCSYYGNGIECENVLHTDAAAIEDLQKTGIDICNGLQILMQLKMQKQSSPQKGEEYDYDRSN